MTLENQGDIHLFSSLIVLITASGLQGEQYCFGRGSPSGEPACPSLGVTGNQDFYLEKIRVFKAGIRLNTLAWNNGIGLWFYFVGF